MNNEQIKQVREAAERWRFKRYTGHVENQLEQAGQDGRLVMDFALSLVDTDGEQPVTDEWLREEWGWKEGGTKRLGMCDQNNLLYWYPQCGSLLPALGIGYRVICSPFTTRYQFRLLAAALGIKRKGEKS